MPDIASIAVEGQEGDILPKRRGGRSEEISVQGLAVWSREFDGLCVLDVELFGGRHVGSSPGRKASRIDDVVLLEVEKTASQSCKSRCSEYRDS